MASDGEKVAWMGETPANAEVKNNEKIRRMVRIFFVIFLDDSSENSFSAGDNAEHPLKFNMRGYI
jgi:hypothetical protein